MGSAKRAYHAYRNVVSFDKAAPGNTHKISGEKSRR
jgi:hypothetical protein